MTKSAVDRVLEDPDNHYPYASDRAREAGIPDELVKVSEAVVKAQEAYLKDPSDANLKKRNDAEKKAQEVSQGRRQKQGNAGPESPTGDDNADAKSATVEGKAR